MAKIKLRFIGSDISGLDIVFMNELSKSSDNLQ